MSAALSRYFIAFAMDTVIGVALAYVGLVVVKKLAFKFDWPSLQDVGSYGTPPNHWVYFKQMGAWCLVSVARHCALPTHASPSAW